ncbi:hypothetical protein [Sphingomonas sp.]|uniref:hypothetical protein n=1 Tax=Sphingomonas sp. TaxID=28214 RepID=UPI003D6D0B97
MKMLRKLIAAGILALPAPSFASPPMSHETIQIIAAALPECTGGWIEPGKRGRVYPMDLAPRLSLLSGPSSALDQRAGEDLYQIAKGLLAPATGVHDRMMDGDASLTCPAHAKEGVALMEYLVDEKPDAWRGYTNAFEWLGLAYETGAAGAKNAPKAQRYYLRFRMHAGGGSEARWSDGVDNNFLGNVERAGLRPYLDALAQSDRGSGGAARLALAEAALPTDPLTARKWLRYLDDRPLDRLLELEQQKRVPSVANGEEIAFWAEASRTLFGYRKYAARLLKAVQDVNGGVIPTSPRRPSIDLLRPHLDMAAVADTDATRDPVPARALVTPEGRAIYIEACSTRPAQSAPLDVFNVQLNVARVYSVRNIANLPKLPIATIGGRPAYGWVILPAVHFTRPDNGKLDIRFVDLPTERCAYSSIADAPPPPVAP